jgi:hypothetical protein
MKNISRQEIISQLEKVYKSECPCQVMIYNWICDFISGRTIPFDRERSDWNSEKVLQ